MDDIPSNERLSVLRGPSTRISRVAVEVLIVDDDADLRTALAGMLSEEGFLVATVEDGGAALSWLRDHSPPRIVLVDLMMPGLDGEALIRAMREEPAWAGVPVVLCTAAGERYLRRRRLDGLPVLTKPFDPDALLSVVTRHARRRATGVPAPRT